VESVAGAPEPLSMASRRDDGVAVDRRAEPRVCDRRPWGSQHAARPGDDGGHPRIKHIVVLMMENRLVRSLLVC